MTNGGTKAPTLRGIVERIYRKDGVLGYASVEMMQSEAATALDAEGEREKAIATLAEALEWKLADGTPWRKCADEHTGSSCCCNCANAKGESALSAARAAGLIP